MIVLHELAHAYHHQVLGMWNPDIRQTYEAAKAKGLYRNVSFWTGNIAPVGYAMSNEREYFAGLTEAYFGQKAQAPSMPTSSGATTPMASGWSSARGMVHWSRLPRSRPWPADPRIDRAPSVCVG